MHMQAFGKPSISVGMLYEMAAGVALVLSDDLAASVLKDSRAVTCSDLDNKEIIEIALSLDGRLSIISGSSTCFTATAALQPSAGHWNASNQVLQTLLSQKMASQSSFAAIASMSARNSGSSEGAVKAAAALESSIALHAIASGCCQLLCGAAAFMPHRKDIQQCFSATRFGARCSSGGLIAGVHSVELEQLQPALVPALQLVWQPLMLPDSSGMNRELRWLILSSDGTELGELCK